MYLGKSYKLLEFIIWTRKSIYLLLIINIIPVVLYEIFEITWIAISWTIVSLLGTAAAFIVGFKNTQTYNRTLEAQQIWTSILSASRSWGGTCKDFIEDKEILKILIYRHLAWLTTLRYGMREFQIWESSNKRHNKEYQRFYTIPEREIPLEKELSKYLNNEELQYIISVQSKPTQIMSLQGDTISKLYKNQEIAVLQFVDLERSIKEFFVLQGRSEQIKNFPYPRQYAIINSLLVNLFCILLPFGMLKEFNKLNENVEGIMKGNMVWLLIPFSILIAWIYKSLGQVGESTENPFEGTANDVPISQISRNIEIDLREMIGEKNLLHKLEPQHDIIL
jgi:putative membrane protein